MIDTEEFEFAFDARFRPMLAMLGIRPTTARVTLRADALVAQFGRWSFETPLANIRQVCETGPYRWYTAIGPRLSMADRGLTFGSTAAGGVCVQLHEPLPGIVPFKGIRHPGLTLTVVEPERLARSLRRATGGDEAIGTGS